MMFCFDMDGTIADLYTVPDWKKKLENEDAFPHIVPLFLCGIWQN